MFCTCTDWYGSRYLDSVLQRWTGIIGLTLATLWLWNPNLSHCWQSNCFFCSDYFVKTPILPHQFLKKNFYFILCYLFLFPFSLLIVDSEIRCSNFMEDTFVTRLCPLYCSGCLAAIVSRNKFKSVTEVNIFKLYSLLTFERSCGLKHMVQKYERFLWNRKVSKQ